MLKWDTEMSASVPIYLMKVTEEKRKNENWHENVEKVQINIDSILQASFGSSLNICAPYRRVFLFFFNFRIWISQGADVIASRFTNEEQKQNLSKW